MIVDRNETLRQLRCEAEGLAAAGSYRYRSMLLSAAELIETQADELEALRGCVRELRREKTP